MANALTLGTVVVNFGTTAKVVGFWQAADGRPSAESGWPILREVRGGKVRGGKWVADPAKCERAA